MAARTGRIRFSEFEAFAVGVVFTVNRDQRRDTKPAKVFLTHFSTRTLRCNHDDGNVVANLHAFFHNVETV